MAVRTTVEVKDFVDPGTGKIQRCTITRHVGLATYIEGGKEILAERATFMDFGPKLGVTRIFSPPREPATEEEKARNREKIYEAVGVAMRRRGIPGTWKGKEPDSAAPSATA